MSTGESVYRAPESALDRPVEGAARSIEDAIAGRWDFDLGEVLHEGWALTNGSKSVIWTALAISIAANVAYQVLNLTVITPSESLPLIGLGFLISLGVSFLGYVINGGVAYYAVKRAAGDESASLADVTGAFSMAGPIIGVMVLLGLAVGLGFLLLIVPGIYLAVGFSFALQLKIERNLGIWESLSVSRQAVHNRWFKVAALMFATVVAVGLGSVLTLGIGAIWLVPFASLVWGVAYREIFGYTGA